MELGSNVQVSRGQQLTAALQRAPLDCYAVKVRSRGEATVSGTLRRMGYEVLLPTYTNVRRYSDRVKEVQRALFPGYVFVRLDKQSLLPLVSTHGVSYIVKSGTAMRPLQPDEVSTIESLCNAETGCEPCESLTVGQHVAIESGPLLGLNGILARVGDNHRLVISLQSIFSSVSIDLRDTIVRPIERCN